MLRWELCDVWGAALEDIGQRRDAEVSLEIGRPRTAKCTISVYDDAAFFLTDGLDRILKVYHPALGDPLICGIITEPDWDLEKGEVSISAIDGWLRLQMAFLHDYLDNSAGVRISQIMWNLITRAANRPYPIGAPPLGITQGTLAVTGLPNEVLNDIYEPGTGIAAKIEELGALLGSNDYYLLPKDREDGMLWQFEAPVRLGVNRGGNVEFHCNTGEHNSKNVRYRPNGSQVFTDYTTVGNLDEGAADIDTFAARPQSRAFSTADQLKFGIYEGWENADTTDSAVCAAKSGEMVTAYHAPPPFFEVEPFTENARATNPQLGAPPEAFVDFGLGDDGIRVIARKGAMNINKTGRCTGITLKEDVRDLKIIPSYNITPDVGGGVTVSYDP